MRAKEPDTRINNKVMSNDAINGVVTRSHLRLIFGASLFMRGTTKGYYRLSVLSIAVMLLVIGFAEYQYNQKTVDAAQWLSHTHQVLDNLESVRSLYTGHFVALHSVLPPANQRPLLHNQSLKSGLEPKLNELFTLIKDNPDQVKLVEKLRIAIAQQSDVLQTDRLVPDNKLEYQQQIVLNIIADIRANEIVLFGQREARNKTYIEQTNKIFTVAIIFGLLITFFFHIVLDFSERKRNLAEQRVRKDRDYFESIFQSLREPVLILNEKFIVQALNQAYLDHFKCKYVDIVGQPVREINNGIWNDDALLAMLQSVYQKNAPLSEYDYAVIRSTYQSVQFSLGARIISSADEANKQIILTIVDLTEKKKAEMEREHFFRLSPEMLAVIDREGTLLATNPAWQRVMGYSERDLTGHLLIDFLHPDDRAAFSRFLSVEDKELLSLNIENRLRSKNGDFRWFNWNCFLSNPDSEIFIAAHDLTEVKMASLQLEEYAAVNLDLYENAPCGYYELNADGQIVRINRTFIEMLGYSREELLGKSIYDFVSGYVPNGKNFQERLAETIDDEAFQANFIKKNGTLLFVHVTGKHLYDQNGEPRGVRATVQDITELKRAKGEVEQYLAELKDLYNNAPCGYHSLDTNGVIVQINDTELQWFGYKRAEIINQRKFVDLITEESRQTFANNFPGFLQRGYVHDLVFECIRANGSKFTILLSATAVYDADGNYVCSRSTMFDITEREAMRDSHGKLAAIVSSATDSIVGLSLEGTILSWNAAAERLYGYSAADIVGKPYTTVIPENLFEQTALFLRKVHEGGEVQAVETLRRNSANRLFYVSLTLSKVVDANGRVVGAAAFEHDISDKIAATNELRMLNESLRHRENALIEVNKELEAFSYSVSHDLRAPLRHIDGFVDMVVKSESEKLSPAGNRYLGIIADSARQMGKLIDDLLSFSRIGRAGMNIQKVKLSLLVEEVFAEQHEEIAGREIEVKIADLPEVYADPGLIRLVWVNLISNAIKYTRKQPHPVITVQCAVSGSEYTFSISDNGAGFDDKYQDKLFGVFQRLHRVDEFEGTGIGLANVRRIVLRHGGRVWASGMINKGATFSFSLPLVYEGIPGAKS